MELKEATASAKELRELYAALEAKRHGRSWNVEEIALGFVGDVGDLAVLVLADRLDVDIEQAFQDTMLDLKRHARSRLGG